MKFSGLSVRQLEAFEMTMRVGSVSKAALALHVSQPSVSRLLQDLEHDTGLNLFDRSEGRLVPTMEGQLFYEEVQKTFSSALRLMDTAQQIKLLKLGSVRLGVMASVSLQHVPAVMREFSAQFPSAMTTLSVCESSRIVDAVSKRTMDLGVIDANTPLNDVQCLETIEHSYLCVMDASHPLGNKSAIEIDDLSGVPFVSLGQDFLSRSADGRRLATAIAGNVKAETYQSFLACALVRDSDAVAIIDPFTAQFYRQMGMLTRPLQAHIPYRISIIANEKSKNSLMTTQFARMLYDDLKNAG